ncbi:NAD-dependent protein deacetylase sirtuin-3-like isoform X6 [Tachypleus tridentatus]
MAATVGKSVKSSTTNSGKSKTVEPLQISPTSISPSLVKKFSELSIQKTEKHKTENNSKIKSPGTGLYDNIQKYNLPYPEAVFDIDYFYMDQRPFFALAKELYPGNYSPNEVHYFVKLLHEKKKLLRMYTQNIDGLERLAGIPSEKLVEAHGSFNTASCIKCGTKHSSEEIKDKIFADETPQCKNQRCKGVVKPDITFFGEQLPARFWYHMTDMPRADLLIVMGTSLEVEPFASISELVRKRIPRLLINRDTVGSFRAGGENDVIQIGDVLESVNSLIHKLKWEGDFKKILVQG